MTDIEYTGRTVDITPTWGGIVLHLGELLGSIDPEARATARAELVRMARAADAWNERARAEGVYITRHGGTEAETRALARVDAAREPEDDGWVCVDGHPTTAPVRVDADTEVRYCATCEVARLRHVIDEHNEAEGEGCADSLCPFDGGVIVTTGMAE